MTDRQLLQQALDALKNSVDTVQHEYDADWRHGLPTRKAQLDGMKECLDAHIAAIASLRERLAQCDRCGKKLGGEGDIHTCTPKADPIGDAQDRLIAELAAQPEQEPVALEAVYKTIIHWDEGGGKRSRRELARRIVTLYTTPLAAPMTEFEEAVAACDNTLHHAIDHWQDKASEQAALLRECRAALDALIDKKPALAMLLCGSTTLGNLKASLHDFKEKST